MRSRYYGDTPEFDDVKISVPNLVKVKEIYLADATGARVDLTSANVKYGKYNLTAILTIDNDCDNNFNTTTGQLSETLRREVEFAPRPMSENTYYLKTKDDQGKETLKKLAVTPVYKKDSSGNPTKEVDRYEVIVPADTYTYNSKVQKPEIVVKNPSLNKSAENDNQGTELVITTETAAGEYTSAVTAHKDAGTYSEKITAVPSVTDEGGNVTTQANYTGDVTVVWTIKKATANVTVAAKEKIVYDGKNLDGDDFDVTATETTPDGLTKEFLETIGKKDSGTTFDVTAAKGTVETKTDYTADEMTSAGGVTVNYENIDSYKNKVINGNLNVEFTQGQTFTRLYVKNNAATIKSYVNNIEYTDFDFVLVDENSTLTYGVDGSLTIGGYIFVPDNGYRLKISNCTKELDPDWNQEIMYIYLDTVPEKKTTTEPKTSDIKNANVDGEVKKANVTIKSKNFEDIVCKQKLDNGNVVAGQDNSLTAKINPRPVTITPKNNNTPFVYGTFVANNEDAKDKFYEEYVTYEAEKQDDKKGTGLVTGEEDIDFSGAFKLVETNGFKFGDAWANDAGSYKYEVVSGFKVPNYTVTVDKNGEFIVSQKTITSDMFSLYYKDNGADKAYSTPFIYGGKAYDVFVKGTDKTTVEKTATFTKDSFSGGTATNGSVTLKASEANKADSPLNLYNDNEDSRNSLSIEVGTGTTISKVVLTYDRITGNSTAITESSPLNEIISYQGHNVTAEIDTEKNTITLTGDVSYISNYVNDENPENRVSSDIYLTKVEVTYTADSTHDLASTDFNTIGVLRGILPDTFYVGIEGTGNYTGTLADTETTGKKWEIQDATLTGKFNVADKYTYTGVSVAEYIEGAVSITGNAYDLFKEEFKGYKPEITYYKKVADDKYTKLDKAPVEVGEYKAEAKFEAEGFKFNNTDNGVITKEFEIIPKDYGYKFDFTKTYGDSDIEIPEEKKLEYDITDLFKEMAESNSGETDYSILSNPLIKALLEKDYVLLSDDELITPIDEQSETATVYVAKGKVSVKAEDIEKSGKYTLDCTGVTVETVEVTINRETNEVTIGEEFTPTKNVIVDGTVLTVDKLKLTKDMFKASTALIVDGKADLTKIVSVADDYTDLMKASDYEVINQSTAVTGTTNVQVTATSEGNFKGTAKVSANVAATSIKDYAMYDSEGRIVFNYENSYGGKDNATYGVLVYRNGEPDTDMTVETAGVINATFNSATGSFLARDLGNGVYVRTYIKIGNDYVYGDQVFVNYEDL